MTTLQQRRNKELEASSVKAARAFVDSGMHGIEAEVVLVLDCSPRMAPLYHDGSLQTLVTSLMALAMKFDDDGVVPVWTFSDEARHAGKVQRDTVLEWVGAHLTPPVAPRPGMRLPATRYAPFIDAIGQRYFPDEWARAPKMKLLGDKLKRQVYEYPALNEPRACPLLVVVVTSGDCEDALETTRQLRRASRLPIFWQFAAVNPSPEVPAELRFLRGIDKLTETHVDSCGFFVADDFASEDLFRGLLGEFHTYVERPEVRAMLVETEASDTSDSNDRIAQDLLALPEREAKKREAARVERERRRAEREHQNALEEARQAAYPKVTPDSDADEEIQREASEAQLEAYYAADSDADEHTVAALLKPSARRETIPYSETVDGKRAITTRPSTRSFARISDPDLAAAKPSDLDDEDTVETAAERLQRIRARREARRGTPD